MARARLLLGISVFWLALSMVFDGINTLLLPRHLLGIVDDSEKATTLGLLSFAGLVGGMIVQPIAGMISDRSRPRWGRRTIIGVGVVLLVPALSMFGASQTLLTVLLSYLLVELALGIAQAGQQALLPDLVPMQWRGVASGFKLFMHTGGSLLAFVVLGQLLTGGQLTPAILTLVAVTIVSFGLSIGLVREPRFASTADVRPLSLASAFRLDLGRERAFVWLVVSRFLFLLGTYAVGRFFFFFIGDRLGLEPGQTAREAGGLLAALTFVTVGLSLPAGWAADRFGRVPLMVVGSIVSAVGALLLVAAHSSPEILLYGGLMALGSAAFASANWALIADLAPPDDAGRFFGLANLGTSGAAAAAGLLGPLVDWGNNQSPGDGYIALFVASALAFFASALPLRMAGLNARSLPASTVRTRA